MAHFALLDQAAEDKLHSTRLLNIEERPFKRITKRLLAPSTPIITYLSRTPKDVSSRATEAPTTTQNVGDEPMSDAAEAAPGPTSLNEDEQTKFLRDLQRFRDDTILDFAAFDSSIARIQFLHLANEKQRQRYAEERVKIQSTSDNVRDDMERLKVRLQEAQQTLQIRKGYDVLAEQITRNRELKARDEQHVNIERLRAEIEELEREGVELGHAWVERREQFGRILDEGARLKRVVRGEPEPDLDDRAGSDGDSDGGSGSDGEENENKREHDGDERSDIGADEHMLEAEEGQRHRGGISNMGTPILRPAGDDDGDQVSTPLPGIIQSGAATPRSPLPDAHVDAAEIERSTPRPVADNQDEENDVEMKGTGAGPTSVPDVKIDDMDVT